MRLFRVESKNIAYDEDISMIILSKSKENAIKLAKDNWCFREYKERIDLS